MTPLVATKYKHGRTWTVVVVCLRGGDPSLVTTRQLSYAAACRILQDLRTQIREGRHAA
jgi:hypothetical protein